MFRSGVRRMRSRRSDSTRSRSARLLARESRRADPMPSDAFRLNVDTEAAQLAKSPFWWRHGDEPFTW